MVVGSIAGFEGIFNPGEMMVWWQWGLIGWGIKTILKNREVRKVLNKAVKSGLHLVEAALRTPYVDFKWAMVDHQPAFQKLDGFRDDGKFTDEELGEVVGQFGDGMPRGVREALYAVEGLLKSRFVDFEWNVEKHKAVFDQLNVMRTDDFFEDEEFADFVKAVRETL